VAWEASYEAERYILIKSDETQFNSDLIKLLGKNQFGINLLKLN
jgi:hypothetical protein